MHAALPPSSSTTFFLPALAFMAHPTCGQRAFAGFKFPGTALRLQAQRLPTTPKPADNRAREGELLCFASATEGLVVTIDGADLLHSSPLQDTMHSRRPGQDSPTVTR